MQYVAQQDYPRELIEHLVVDGGSTDGTLDVAREYGARVLSHPEWSHNQEARHGIGALEARNEVVVYLDSDNFLTSSSWLKKMVHPLLDDSEIIASQTLRYGVRPGDPLLTRYYGLLGANDPVAYYLNKRDRISWAEDKWHLSGLEVDKADYFKVRFTEQNLPTVGMNGFLIWRNILLKGDCRPDAFVHMDVQMDLIRLGYTCYGIVKNDIVHYTGRGLVPSLTRRVAYWRTFEDVVGDRKRYYVFDKRRKRDWLNLAKYVLYSATLVKPLWDAMRGFWKRRDWAWFLHPVLCLGTMIAYGAGLIWVTSRKLRRALLRRRS